MKTAETARFNPVYEKLSPAQVAEQVVDAALQKLKQTNRVLLAMGEEHQTLSHQVSQALALKKLAEKGHNPTLFMELPSNILFLTLKRGEVDVDKAKIWDTHSQEVDTMGHFRAKCIIGLGPYSVGMSLLIQTALHHDVPIIFADAAKKEGVDSFLDTSDLKTQDIATGFNIKLAKKILVVLSLRECISEICIWSGP